MLSATFLTALGLVATSLCSPISTTQQPLRFTADGTFQLCVFEDLHFGEAENLVWGPQQDVNTTRVMNTVLDVESPQLVVLNGDLITGENTYLANSTHYVDEIVQPLVQRGLSWASTYGNHDSQFNLSREDILKREGGYPNSLTKQMVKTNNSGVTNYYLPVFSANSSDSTPELILWFFDSRGGFYFQESYPNGTGIAQPDWVDVSVVDWFNKTKIQLGKKYGDSEIPSLAFVHIPVNAMLAFQDTGVKPHKEPGINADTPLAQQGQGNDNSYYGQDIPFMAALLDTPGLMGVFSGHDHGDDWCSKWDTQLPGMTLKGNGLNLCFGRHTGYGGYGSWTRGARQVVVNRSTIGKSVETYIRLEDESVSGRVMLNGTYGKDKYPKVPLTYTP